MKRGLILVEGQSEERFVKDVLGPHLSNHGLQLDPTILITKRVKSGKRFKGGVTSFARLEKDVRRLLASGRDALITTMIDYYGLPKDFPGMATRKQFTSPTHRVEHVEQRIRAHFDSVPNFIPFLMLHEFEACLFSDPSILPQVLHASGRAGDFSAIRRRFTSPEEINEEPSTAPSKRIEALFGRGYQKALHGPQVAKRIGLEAIRRECPHFAKWLAELENFAAL